jgi:hypothetical protein
MEPLSIGVSTGLGLQMWLPGNLVGVKFTVCGLLVCVVGSVSPGGSCCLLHTIGFLLGISICRWLIEMS